MGSAYVAAIQDDDEIGEELLAKIENASGKSRISPLGFTREMYLLTRGFNMLAGPLAALAGADPENVSFLDGPDTAIVRAKSTVREKKQSRLLAKVVPHQFDN